VVISATDLRAAIDSAAAADNDFSGVVRIDTACGEMIAAAYGLADRAWEIPNTVEAIFATASAAKGFTALAVMSLVEDGILNLDTTARSLRGTDLPISRKRRRTARITKQVCRPDGLPVSSSVLTDTGRVNE